MLSKSQPRRIRRGPKSSNRLGKQCREWRPRSLMILQNKAFPWSKCPKLLIVQRSSVPFGHEKINLPVAAPHRNYTSSNLRVALWFTKSCVQALITRRARVEPWRWASALWPSTTSSSCRRKSPDHSWRLCSWVFGRQGLPFATQWFTSCGAWPTPRQSSSLWTTRWCKSWPSWCRLWSCWGQCVATSTTCGATESFSRSTWATRFASIALPCSWFFSRPWCPKKILDCIWVGPILASWLSTFCLTWLWLRWLWLAASRFTVEGAQFGTKSRWCLSRRRWASLKLP